MFVVCFAMHILRNEYIYMYEENERRDPKKCFYLYLGESELPLNNGS
jgi:hypothetical protein